MNPHTRQLLLAVTLLGAIDLGILAWRREPVVASLPSTPAFDPAAATALRIIRPGETLALLRTPAGWALSSEAGAPADPDEVQAVLGPLASGLRLDLRVGDTDAETYGLSGGDELRVEVDGAGGRLSAFYIGHDAGGGATFVRLPDDEVIYRARIGGRARYDRPAGAWRDRRVTDLPPGDVAALTVTTADGALTATRSGAGWSGAPDPVDGPTVDAFVSALSSLRAAEVLPSERAEEGIDWGFATVNLETDRTSGATIELAFGRRGDLRFVRRGDRVEQWRIVAPWVDRLSALGTFRDRALWAGPPIDRFVVRAPGREGVLARTAAGWRIERPANVDVDPARADAVASWLASPRVARWDVTGLVFPGDHRWEVTVGGRTREIVFGPTRGEEVAVRVEDRVGWIELRVVQVAEGLFGG